MNAFRKRISISGITGSDITEDNIDDLMKNLYAAPDLLDKKCQDAANVKLAVTLPTSASTNETADDLTTSYEKTPEAVVEGLPKEYFTPKYDAVGPHLEEISSWDESEMLEKFMNKIEEADTDKDVIIGHLTGMIDENYDELMECMRSIQSIDIDLCRAGIQLGHGRQKIRSACDIIHSGAIVIKGLHGKRERLVKVSETIRSLQALKDIHQAMINSINTGEVGNAASHAKSVLECLNHESYDQFRALHSIGESTHKSIVTIRQKSDKALKRLCGRKFTTADYENILTAYVVLDHLSDTMPGVDMHNRNSMEGAVDSSMSFYYDSVGCIEGLSQRINRFQLEDIDACLHSAVMEYIYASQQKKHRAASELSIAGAYMQMDMGEIVDLAEVPLNILYRRLTTDMIAPCVVRSCELLADVVHTHFLLAQWHRTPFHARNHDEVQYLHRCNLPMQSKPSKPQVQTQSQSLREDRRSKGVSAKTSAVVGGTPDDRLNDEDAAAAEEEEAEEEEDDDDEDDDDYFLQGEEAVGAVLSQQSAVDWQQQLEESVHKGIVDCFQESFPSLLQKFSMQSSANSSITSLSNRSSSSSSSSGNTANSSLLAGEDLCIVFAKLLQSRQMLWDEMLRALVNMLGMMHFTAEVKIEDFLAMAWALNAMVQLGTEFCGSSSQALLDMLQEKSREYFYNFHCESFHTLRDMIEAESWQNVPIDLVESDGILGLIKAAIQRDGARSGRIFFKNHNMDKTPQSPPPSMKTIGEEEEEGEEIEEEAEQERGMLMRFGTDGNPFHFLTHNSSSSSDGGGSLPSTPTTTAAVAGDDIDGDDSNNNINNNNNNILASPSPAKSSGGGGGLQRKELESFWRLLQDDDDDEGVNKNPTTTTIVNNNDTNSGTNNNNNNTTSPLPSPGPARRKSISRRLSKREAEQADKYTVVTQAALNGVTKYVAKYLHLMYLLRTNSLEIFENLCQLFDYYICAVFNGFMPVEEKQKFLAVPTKFNAPPPDISKEFQTLQTYLAKTLETMVTTSTLTADAAKVASLARSFSNDDNNNTSHHNVNSNNSNHSTHSTHSSNDDRSSAGGATPSPSSKGAMSSSSSASNNNSNSSAGTSMEDNSASSTGQNNDNNRNNNNNNNSGSSNNNSNKFNSSSMVGTARKLSSLLRPPAIPLNMESTCMALNERIVAAESCFFISLILKDLQPKLVKLVAPSATTSIRSKRREGEEEEEEKRRAVAAAEKIVDDYIRNFHRVCGQLRALLYRASCPQLIKHHQILQAIVSDCSWDFKKVRTEVHDWVYTLANNCRMVWDYMMLAEQFVESSPLLREQVWMEICQAAFDVALEGFTKVRKCSAEGRAAMTMDNFALHDALNQIHLCRPPRGKHYIDAFLRASLSTEAELMQWIQENWQGHAYRHVHGVLTQNMSSMLNSKKLKDATAVIDSLYEFKDSSSNGTYTNSDGSSSAGSAASNALSGFISQGSASINKLRRQSIL